MNIKNVKNKLLNKECKTQNIQSITSLIYL
jgi:hypothetical protein